MGKLFVISAPSGTGKTSLIKAILEDPESSNTNLGISCTTRKARPKEENGISYFFITTKRFSEKIRNNEFKIAGYEGKDPVIIKKVKSNKSTMIASNITKSKLARAGKQRMYRKQMKGLDVKQFSENFEVKYDIINDNIFNIVKEENILPWKKIELKDRKTEKKTLILIGPEGDFSQTEIDKSTNNNNYQSISLGSNRLRTETAGVVSVTTINNNQ